MILSSVLTIIGVKFTNQNTSEAVWQDLNVIEVRGSIPAEITDKPLQMTDLGNAATVMIELSSSKVIMPSKLYVKAIALDADTLNLVLSAHNDQLMMLQALTKSVSIPNLVVTRVRAKASSNVVNGFELDLELEQALSLSTEQSQTPEQGADAAASEAGMQQLGGSSSTVDSIISSLKAKL